MMRVSNTDKKVYCLTIPTNFLKVHRGTFVLVPTSIHPTAYAALPVLNTKLGMFSVISYKAIARFLTDHSVTAEVRKTLQTVLHIKMLWINTPYYSSKKVQFRFLKC
jgi:hypothetical protein